MWVSTTTQASRPTPRYKAYVRLYSVQEAYVWVSTTAQDSRPTHRYKTYVRFYSVQEASVWVSTTTQVSRPTPRYKTDVREYSEESSYSGQYHYTGPSFHSKAQHICTAEQKAAAVDSTTALAPLLTLR